MHISVFDCPKEGLEEAGVCLNKIELISPE